MKQSSVYDILTQMFCLLVMIIIIIIVIKASIEAKREALIAEKCDQSCIIYKSKVIDGVCHCLNEKGWRKLE